MSKTLLQSIDDLREALIPADLTEEQLQVVVDYMNERLHLTN